MNDVDLHALRDKYEKILRLRLSPTADACRASASGEPLEPSVRDSAVLDPKTAMAELARAYPGALRELDGLELSVIRARIAEVRAAETDSARIAPWMRAHTAFHRLARGALAAKRWLGRRDATANLAETFAREASSLENAEALEWKDHLGSIARPPGGRLMDVVFARLAEELGTDVASVRALVLPPHTSLRSGRFRR